MVKGKGSSAQAIRHEAAGLETLGIRVSEMINHPIAQLQRWVTIHRLDTDGEREWKEVMGLLSETDGIKMTLNEDESVTLRWETSNLTARDELFEEQNTEEEAVEVTEPPF